MIDQELSESIDSSNQVSSANVLNELFNSNTIDNSIYNDDDEVFNPLSECRYFDENEVDVF